MLRVKVLPCFRYFPNDITAHTGFVVMGNLKVCQNQLPFFFFTKKPCNTKRELSRFREFFQIKQAYMLYRGTFKQCPFWADLLNKTSHSKLGARKLGSLSNLRDLISICGYTMNHPPSSPVTLFTMQRTVHTVPAHSVVFRTVQWTTNMHAVKLYRQ